MADLIVVGFKKDMYRASEVLNRLMELKDDWAFDLQDGVAVYRAYNGKLRVDQSYQMMTTGEGAGIGALWGVLIGALIAIPFTGGVSGAAAAGTMAAGAASAGVLGAAAGAVNADSLKSEFGISDAFVRSVGTLVQPGGSAIMALLRTANPQAVAAQFRGYGGEVLQTNLSKEQTAKIQSMLSGGERVLKKAS
jgi:uncharacterized membrane protein